MDARARAAVVSGLVEPFRGERITAVCGIESRGFRLGAAAVELGAGFVPVRKAGGHFPGDVVERRTSPDYRRLRHTLRLQRASLVDQLSSDARPLGAVRVLTAAGDLPPSDGG